MLLGPLHNNRSKSLARIDSAFYALYACMFTLGISTAHMAPRKKPTMLNTGSWKLIEQSYMHMVSRFLGRGLYLSYNHEGLNILHGYTRYLNQHVKVPKKWLVDAFQVPIVL